MKVQVGRFSPTQAVRFSKGLTHGVGYFGFGPVVVMFSLPKRWRKPDPSPRRVISPRAIFTNPAGKP